MEGDPMTHDYEQQSALATQYEQTIRTYFDGCNEADVAKMEACFTPDAVHYFPPSMYGGAWCGARLIAERWAQFVATKGSAWTIDRLVVEPRTHQAVIEWTHYKTAEGTILRGDEWYVFDPESGLISEIRAYYAAAQHPGVEVTELEDFDYAGRDYHLSCPVPRPHPTQATA
jgi:methyltransferase